MLDTGIAVVKRKASIESLIDVDFGSRKAEAFGLLGDLKAVAIPLHDIVVADDAFVHEAADAFEILRSLAPDGCGFARQSCEAAVVVGDELAEHSIGRVDVSRFGQTEFAGETILQHAPETFDAAFGLRAVGGDEGDAELIQGAAELSGLAFSGELFLDSPVIVVAEEDATAIAIESEGKAVTAEQLAKQAEIAESSFRGEELGGEDFAGGVVLHAESGEQGAAAFEPVMRRTVELHKFTDARRTQAALAVSGRASFTRRAQAALAQQAA